MPIKLTLKNSSQVTKQPQYAWLDHLLWDISECTVFRCDVYPVSTDPGTSGDGGVTSTSIFNTSETGSTVLPSATSGTSATSEMTAMC